MTLPREKKKARLSEKMVRMLRILCASTRIVPQKKSCRFSTLERAISKIDP
jgi:hypothetical protein